MAFTIYYRLTNQGDGNPGPVQTVQSDAQITGNWAVVSGIPPDTDYQVSLVSANGPWQDRRTRPVSVIPSDRVPVQRTTRGGRPNAIPARFYDDARTEFIDPIEHPHIMGITHRTIKSGRFTDPTTWDTGTVPGTGSVWAVSNGHVLIGDNNSDVIFKDALIERHGTFRLAQDTETRWRLDTMMAMGNFVAVDHGISATPGKPKHEFIFHIQEAPGASTRGGLMTMGPVRLHGAKKKSFLRLGLTSGQSAPAVMAGATTAYLPGLSDAGWHVGQTIIFGGTEYVPLRSDPQYTGPPQYHYPQRNSTRQMNQFQFGQEEQRVIVDIDGDMVTFDSPLIYDHTGITETLPQGQVVTISPVVANPCHSIEFRSASAAEDSALDSTADLSDLQKRAHTMFMRHADVDTRYASFKNLGRTDVNPTLWVHGWAGGGPLLDGPGGNPIANPINVRGRYPIHFHWAGGPYMASPQINAIGLTSWAPIDEVPIPGWAFTQHSTRMAVEDCFTFNVRGAGFVSELGNETGHWVDCLAMFTRSDGEGHGWGDRHEELNNHNGAGGIGFENQSRMIRMKNCVAVSCRYGYLWHAQRSNLGGRVIRDIDIHYADGLVQGVHHVWDLNSFNDFVSPVKPQIPLFEGNECQAVRIGFEIIHRLGSPENTRDSSPMLMERYHCLRTVRAFSVPQYSFNYYINDSLWKGPTGRASSAAVLGNVTFAWNFANIKLIDYVTQFVDSGAGLNYDGFFIDIEWVNGDNFTNAPIETRSGLTSHPAWNVMGDAEVIDANSGRLRRYKPITAADLPQPYPAAPYGFGGVLPPGYTFPQPGELPYFILADNSNTTIGFGTGRNRGSVHGMIVDCVGVRRWPDGQSSETPLQNTSVKGPTSLVFIQPEQLVQRWGCWDDAGTLKTRVWFPMADRYTHARDFYHIDFTITGNAPEGFVEAHILDGPMPKPEWPDKLEYAPEEQPPLQPVAQDIRFLSNTDLRAVSGQPMAHKLLTDCVNVRFSILPGLDADDFQIMHQALRWAQNGTRENGNYSCTVRVMDVWGNTRDQVHTVSVVPDTFVDQVQDNFTASDGTTLEDHGWTRLRGDADVGVINNNRLEVAFTPSVRTEYLKDRLTSSDMSIRYSFSQTNHLNYLIFRVVDENNWLGIARSDWPGNTIRLAACIDGSITIIGHYQNQGANICRLLLQGRRITLAKLGNNPWPVFSLGGSLTALENDTLSYPSTMLLPEQINGVPLPNGTGVGVSVREARTSWLNHLNASTTDHTETLS